MHFLESHTTITLDYYQYTLRKNLRVFVCNHVINNSFTNCKTTALNLNANVDIMHFLDGNVFQNNGAITRKYTTVTLDLPMVFDRFKPVEAELYDILDDKTDFSGRWVADRETDSLVYRFQ